LLGISPVVFNYGWYFLLLLSYVLTICMASHNSDYHFIIFPRPYYMCYGELKERLMAMKYRGKIQQSKSSTEDGKISH
jgi:hypothetical protein